MEPTILILGLIVFVVIAIVKTTVDTKAKAADIEAQRRRREALAAKYGSAEIADMIMRRMFWVNQTQAQLIDSLGRPADIDQKVLKTKVKETWKYNQAGRNRFGLRIVLETGLVVGWDQK